MYTHLFKVGAHEDDEVGERLCLLLEEGGVLLCLVDVVNRARADDDDELVALAAEDRGDLGARLCDGALRRVADGDLGLEERGLDEGLDLKGRGHRVEVSACVGTGQVAVCGAPADPRKCRQRCACVGRDDGKGRARATREGTASTVTRNE